MNFDTAFERCPLVAILRGLPPADALEIGSALVDLGFTMIEVPLNSPEPLRSIETLAGRYEGHAIIGAGTVMSAGDVEGIERAGGQLVVMPHGDALVISAAKKRRLVCLPGVATPSEAFAALAVGADALKAFPGEMVTPPVLKAWRAVLPKSVRVIPVGGIGAANMADYLAAGASGFGLGSSLYVPGDDARTVSVKGKRIMEAWDRATGTLSV